MRLTAKTLVSAGFSRLGSRTNGWRCQPAARTLNPSSRCGRTACSRRRVTARHGP